MQFHQICGRQVPACEDEVPELIISWAIQHVPEPLLHSGLTWTFLACRYAVPLVLQPQSQLPVFYHEHMKQLYT